ncbi:hypothetical protein N7492_002674 [Penicillium capsulatum]|uniref:protein-tyrosine-phosphatase n=1 Tax=Penicillium capsulatum TaxID=69766 RepID=A0A9W9IKH4_9EURO|nr:hypothetical protein N7492_002674 [Penicillium capsulatum]KAJ6122728.1 hypothetical protein N7512_005193 [Penicillium capsulatum]
MAMNQVPGHNIYVGGIFCLKNKAGLERANITHVLSVLRMNPSEKTFAGYEHHSIDIDDVDDENLLEHFPAAVKFIQSGLDAGGSVLIHCAMGKSRSAAVCIAYLLQKRANTLTPNMALDIIRTGRPLCEPNDGFMEQLNLYYEMGCPDDVVNHSLYQRWLYRRDVEESVACGRAPEMSSVRFEDEQPTQSSAGTGRAVEIKCRKCRRTLASTPHVIPHEQEKQNSQKTRVNAECGYLFLHPLKWMQPSLFPSPSDKEYTGEAPLSGRLICPNPACGGNIGKFAWQGMQCSCNNWVVPAIGLAKARVDIASRVNPVERGSHAALGIRLPPGMRSAEPHDSGRGNL